MRKDIPLSEVAQHKAPNDAWTVLNGKARRYSWCALRVVTAASSHNCFVERGEGGSRMRATLAEKCERMTSCTGKNPPDTNPSADFSPRTCLMQSPSLGKWTRFEDGQHVPMQLLGLSCTLKTSKSKTLASVSQDTHSNVGLCRSNYCWFQTLWRRHTAT